MTFCNENLLNCGSGVASKEHSFHKKNLQASNILVLEMCWLVDCMKTFWLNENFENK